MPQREEAVSVTRFTYLVMCSFGEYSDKVVFPVASYNFEDQAKEHIEKAKAIADELIPQIDNANRARHFALEKNDEALVEQRHKEGQELTEQLFCRVVGKPPQGYDGSSFIPLFYLEPSFYIVPVEHRTDLPTDDDPVQLHSEPPSD